MITSILLAAVAVAAGPDVDYGRDVKPILAARCTSCHGSIRQKAGLRLDTAELIRRGGDGGPAIEPGRAGASLLIERVTAAKASERMPPESEGVPLNPAEVAVLTAWIDWRRQGSARDDSARSCAGTGLSSRRDGPRSRRILAHPGAATRSTACSPRPTAVAV